MDETQIIERCRKGDREGQRELYELTCDRIYRLLLRMSRNRDDAAELTQNTYIRVFERFHQFDAAANVATWVYRIAVNEALQFLRARHRGPATMAEAPESDRLGSDLAATDNRLDVREALDRLPEEERVLIALRYFEGLDYAEMARVLEKPAGTIASGLNRARRLLREILGADEETPGARHRIE